MKFGVNNSALTTVRAVTLCAALVIANIATANKGVAAVPRVDYEYTGDISLGAPSFYDYLTLDAASHHLYISHFDQVAVVDTRSRKVIGAIGPLKGSHGVAIVPNLGKGYADSGDDGVVAVFDLATLQIIKRIKISKGADGMVYDERSGSVLVVAGDAKNLTVISSVDDTVLRTISLPGKPEFLAPDNSGQVYVNITDNAAICKVDIASGKIEAIWPLKDCEAPHGLAYDAQSNRLFSGCASGHMVVVNASDGENVANLAIGTASDGLVIDSRRRLVLTSNWPGTVTAVRLGEGDHYAVARTLPTFFGGRNMTLDPDTGTLFVAHGHTTIVGTKQDVLNLRFGWDGVEVAVFEPQP